MCLAIYNYSMLFFIEKTLSLHDKHVLCEMLSEPNLLLCFCKGVQSTTSSTVRRKANSPTHRVADNGSERKKEVSPTHRNADDGARKREVSSTRWASNDSAREKVSPSHRAENDSAKKRDLFPIHRAADNISPRDTGGSGDNLAANANVMNLNASISSRIGVIVSSENPKNTSNEQVALVRESGEIESSFT